MSSEMKGPVSQKVVMVGTGGTIAGLSLIPGTGGAYRAAQVSVEDLLAQAEHNTRSRLLSPRESRSTTPVVTEQLVQVDSKDMTEAIWQRLLARLWQLQQDPTVQAVVITHGTDTLEETGFLLQACWPQGKPVVLTCAMRPADAPDADGPGNVRDALMLASVSGLRGVVMVCAGEVFEGHSFQKVWAHGLQPFAAEPGGSIGVCRPGRFEPRRAIDLDGAYPALTPTELSRVLSAPCWPRVEIVLNHVGADGRVVKALMDQSATEPHPHKLRGIVLAGTGQGTCSERLSHALQAAHQQGVRVWRSTRAAWGSVHPREEEVFTAVPWSPVKARVAMMLELLSGRH